MAPTELQQYSLAQVAEHNKPNDVWMVIHDKVYDVTKFLAEVILIRCFLLYCTLLSYAGSKTTYRCTLFCLIAV